MDENPSNIVGKHLNILLYDICKLLHGFKINIEPKNSFDSNDNERTVHCSNNMTFDRHVGGFQHHRALNWQSKCTAVLGRCRCAWQFEDWRNPACEKLVKITVTQVTFWLAFLYFFYFISTKLGMMFGWQDSSVRRREEEEEVGVKGKRYNDGLALVHNLTNTAPDWQEQLWPWQLGKGFLSPG